MKRRKGSKEERRIGDSSDEGNSSQSSPQFDSMVACQKGPKSLGTRSVEEGGKGGKILTERGEKGKSKEGSCGGRKKIQRRKRGVGPNCSLPRRLST